MANDSTICVGFLFITPSVVVLLMHMWFFGVKVWHSVWCVFCFFGCVGC